MKKKMNKIKRKIMNWEIFAACVSKAIYLQCNSGILSLGL